MTALSMAPAMMHLGGGGGGVDDSTINGASNDAPLHVGSEVVCIILIPTARWASHPSHPRSLQP